MTLDDPNDDDSNDAVIDSANPSYLKCSQMEGDIVTFLDEIGNSEWWVAIRKDPDDFSKFQLIAYAENGSPYSNQDCESKARALQQVLAGDTKRQWLVSCIPNGNTGEPDLLVTSAGQLAATNYNLDVASDVLGGVTNDPSNPGATGSAQYNPATDSYDLYVNAPADPEYW